MDVTPKIRVVTVPGQGGNKGAKEAAKAKPDGCTLFAIHQSAVTSYLNKRIDFQYDGFETVANLTSTPDIIGAAKDTPYNSYEEFIDYAKIFAINGLMYPVELIKKVTALYRDYDVKPFCGGILFETAYHQNAVDELISHLQLMHLRTDRRGISRARSRSSL